jgi:protein SCO1/2
MNLGKKINTIFFVLVIIIPFSVFGLMRWINNNYTSLPYYGGTQAVKQSDGSTKEIQFTVPQFEFINQANKNLSSDFVKGKIWVADYFFTKCTSICPKLTTHLQKVQQAFKQDSRIKIISFTVDPDRDSPGVLRSYAGMFHADASQWQFVTGDKKDLYAFARKGLFIIATDGDGGADDFIHSEKLVLIDAQNHIRGYYDGTSDTEVDQLIKDIQRLKNEN